MDNILAIYKPKGWTSHDVIAKLRSVTKIKRIGHAGTLDPLAEGVLVIGIGREATKLLNIHLQKEKEYEATIQLGETSTTEDAEGEKTKIKVTVPPKINEVQQVLKSFVGTIEQIPPIYSSIKVAGKRAYKYARKGKVVEMKPRIITIHSIELLSYQWPQISIRVKTNAGVYIRSLARDIGEKLKTGGYLFSLKRTRVGEFDLSKTRSIEEFTKDFLKT